MSLVNRAGEGTSIKYRELSIRDGYDNFKTETLFALYLWFGVYKGLNG